MRRRAFVHACCLALLACGGSGDDLVLDGRPFVADRAGVVDDVSRERIVVDTEPLELADEIVVFSASSLETVSLAGRRGQYVQVGLDDGAVRWVASVGAVLGSDDPFVLFEGRVASVDRSVVTFRSGYRVEADDGVDVPVDRLVLVRIDPRRDRITQVEVRG